MLGALHKPVLYLSHYFKQHRQAYYEHLQAVRDRGAWEAWLAFSLRGSIAAAECKPEPNATDAEPAESRLSLVNRGTADSSP